MIGNAKGRVFAVRGVAAACQPPRARPLRGYAQTSPPTCVARRRWPQGLSIRATGRLLGVDKDTANHWLPVLGQHCQSVMNYFFRNLHLLECQLDELWTFIHKKEDRLTSLEKLAEVSGDAWVWIAFSPVYKLVPAWVVGKRTLRHARRLLFGCNRRPMGISPSFPVRHCHTMPTPCWRCMVCGAHRPGKGHVGVCLNRAATRHPTCATRS